MFKKGMYPAMASPRVKLQSFYVARASLLLYILTLEDIFAYIFHPVNNLLKEILQKQL